MQWPDLLSSSMLCCSSGLGEINRQVRIVVSGLIRRSLFHADSSGHGPPISSRETLPEGGGRRTGDRNAPICCGGPDSASCFGSDAEREPDSAIAESAPCGRILAPQLPQRSLRSHSPRRRQPADHPAIAWLCHWRWKAALYWGFHRSKIPGHPHFNAALHPRPDAGQPLG